MRLVVEHQIGARQQGQTDGDDAHQLGQRPGERIIAGDFHSLAVIVLADVVETPPLVALHGEGLDDLDAAEGLFQGIVKLGHLFHGPAIGAFEHFGQPLHQQTGQGRQQKRKDQKPPTNTSRADQANHGFDRLAHELAEKRHQAHGQIFHVVGETRHQVAGAVFIETSHVHPQNAAVKNLLQVERGQVRKAGHEYRIAYQKTVFDDRAQEQETYENCQRPEWIAG